MSISPKVLGVLGALALAGAVFANGRAARGAFSVPATAPEVVEERAIGLPDAEIISLSPDGTRLAAVTPAGRTRGDGRLCTYDVATLAQAACAALSGIDAGLSPGDVVWSPDGTRIAFTEAAFDRFRDSDLSVMDVATGTLKNLTDDGATGRLPGPRPAEFPAYFVDVSPAWTADGKSIAISRSTWRDGAWQGNDLVLVDAGTGAAESLATVSAVEEVVAGPMAWTADGGKLYYSVAVAKAGGPAQGLWVLDRRTGTTGLVIATGPNEESYPFQALSPRGDFLLTSQPRAATQFALPESLSGLLNLTTGTIVPLTMPNADASGDSPPVVLAAFSPDGSLIVTVTSRTALVMIRPVDADGGAVVASDVPRPRPSFAGQAVQWAGTGTLYVPGSDPGSGTLLRLDRGGAATPVASSSPDR